MKKLGQFILDLFLCFVLLFAAIAILLVVVSNRDVDGAAEIFGHQLRIVTSDSMGECEHTDVSQYEIKSIPVESLIVVKTMPKDNEAAADEWYRSIKVGDVLTFRYVYGRQITITHRVASITEKEGGFIIELAGDNINAKDNQLYQTIDTSISDNPNYVVGKVVWTAKWAGQLLGALRTPIGLIFLIWIPCVLVVIMQVYEIGSAEGSSQRERAVRRARRVYAPNVKETDDISFIRYVDRQYEKAQGRSWRKYVRQYRRKKATVPLPRYGNQSNGTSLSWKRYAQQYKGQDAPERIPRLNPGNDEAASIRELKQYASYSQNQERTVPMPRFKTKQK